MVAPIAAWTKVFVLSEAVQPSSDRQELEAEDLRFFFYFFLYRRQGRI